MAAETGERGAAPGPRARTWRPTNLRRDLRGGRDGLKVKPDASSPFPFGLKAAGHAEPGRPLPVGDAAAFGGAWTVAVVRGAGARATPGTPPGDGGGAEAQWKEEAGPGRRSGTEQQVSAPGGRPARGVGPGRKARAPGRQEGDPQRGDAAGGAQTRREPGRGMGTGLIQEESQN